MRTTPLYDMICPKCGERGQLKLQNGKYYRIDHYSFKNGFRHGKRYEYSCYFGLTLGWNPKPFRQREMTKYKVIPSYCGVPEPSSDTTNIKELEYMPELAVHIRELPEQAKTAGVYKIMQPKEPYAPIQTRQGRAIILLVQREGETSGKIYSLFVPYYDEPTQRTNLARLLQAFGTNTDKWIGRKVKLERDAATGKATLSGA